MVRNALTPITYEEACTEVTRFLMHYPRRHIEQDAVVVQDLADEFESRNLGIAVVVRTLQNIRNEFHENNPWIPQTGYIIKEMMAAQKTMIKHFERLRGRSINQSS